MTTLTVTATQGGLGASQGMALRVFVLTGAKPVASQTGGVNSTNFATTTTNFTASITTTQTGSRVYGAISHSPQSTDSGAAATTIVDNINDSVNGEEYVTYKATSVTGTPGATTLGITLSGTAAGGPLAMAEILTSGTLAEDASGPAVVSVLGSGSTLTVTTASFNPPAGSLLVALVPSNGGASQVTMTVTDNLGTHLNWHEQVKTNVAGNDYAGVWIADVPGAAPAGLLPQQEHRRVPLYVPHHHHPQPAYTR